MPLPPSGLVRGTAAIARRTAYTTTPRIRRRCTGLRGRNSSLSQHRQTLLRHTTPVPLVPVARSQCRARVSLLLCHGQYVTPVLSGV